MDENQAQVSVARIVGGCVVVVILAVAGCEFGGGKVKNDTLAEMVKAGADPISASCAMNRISEETCRAHILKK